MKPMPLTHFLPVLDARPRQMDPPRLLELPRADLHLVANNMLPEPEPEFEMPPLTASEYDRGYDEGRAAAEAEAADRMAAEEARVEARIEARLAAARAEWCQQQADLLTSGVDKALTVIEASICEGAERVLRQVVEASLRARALQQFTEAVGRLLRDGEAGVVTVHGPCDLLDALRPMLEPLCATVDYNENDGAEVWVRVDQTLIETRFASWRGDLQIEG
ncbi:MAG: hypothetical protein K2X62_00435 [Beijerinckiaceae bacterium]|jgi:hypothetical protein|nr:hypothetical protein [Beijerinckiaceae bacterium]